MADSFKMYDTFDATTGLPGATFDILESHHLLALVDIAKVKQNICTYNLYAPDHVIEDSNIVAEYLKNCCNDTLKAKIDEKISKYPKAKRGGVVFYFLLMELISPSRDSHSYLWTKFDETFWFRWRECH